MFLESFVADLAARYRSGALDFAKEKPQFQAFAKSVPEGERVQLLLIVYDRYRALGEGCPLPATQDYFHASTYSMLISALLDTKLKPTPAEACAILRNSVHYCGHGGDVETPLELAEKAFDKQPYSSELFAAVRTYQAVLKGTRSTTAQNVKRKLGWILWHDASLIDSKCCMARAQRDIAAMPESERFAWEWLLRHTTATLNNAAGKSWLKEGEKRLAAVGADAFVARLDAWTQFPPEPILITAEGSCVLRLLIWYASLVEPAKALPLVARIAGVNWLKPEPAAKVKSALSWLLGQHEEYRATAEQLSQELAPAPKPPTAQSATLADLIATLAGSIGTGFRGR